MLKILDADWILNIINTVRYIATVCMLLLATCSQRKGGIIIAGSTSVQPFIEKIAEYYMEENPGIQINVQGGGSTAGIQATFNKTCQIGTSSRNLKPSERGLKIYVLAVDGIAVIVHKDNPIDDISIDQIQGIFSGTIKDWSELGEMQGMIIPVTREEGSGTRGAFEEMVMGEKVISDVCLVQDSNGAVREIIATTLQGIGYISVGLVDEREKALAINGVEPSLANLISCKYRFTRPFLLILDQEPAGIIKSFIDYALSDKGQAILKSDGLISGAEIIDD